VSSNKPKLKSATNQFSFKTLQEDLLTLEVNTIVKADMSACKMPANRREALLEIAKGYHYKLVDLDAREPIIWSSAGIMAFLELRERAVWGEQDCVADLKELAKDNPNRQAVKEKMMMLGRIQSQSEQLVSTFIQMAHQYEKNFNLNDYREKMAERIESSPDFQPFDETSSLWNNDLDRGQMQLIEDLDLDAAQISLIRKIWEIGTERVALQTLIHADGDITTRIAERFVHKPNQTLFKIHQDAVENSVGFWSSLIDTIGKFASSVLGGKSF
jgi:prophage DNA circulation protein